MKRKKLWMAGMMVFMMTAAVGCSEQESEPDEGIPVTKISNEKEDVEKQTDEQTDVVNNIAAEGDGDNAAPEQAVNDDTGNMVWDSDSEEMIGGKVRSVDTAQESFVISLTLMDADGCVTMPEVGSPDEQLVTVRCTNSTIFEYWTIQGGGAGIVTREASFSEIAVDGGLEAAGHYEGDNFIADKIIIEVYQ